MALIVKPFDFVFRLETEKNPVVVVLLSRIYIGKARSRVGQSLHFCVKQS